MIKKHNKKRSHFWEYLLINVFVFAGIGILSFFVLNISLFNSFTQAFRDFTFTDIYYSSVMNHDKIYNGPLVLVDMESRSRTECARLLEKLESGSPKVIGIDAIFPVKPDSGNGMLRAVIAKNKNLVLPFIASFDSSVDETRSDDYFQAHSNAYVNMVGDNPQYTTVRYYYPEFHKIPAFTTAIMQLYDSALSKSLEKRGDNKTEIKYYGNLQNFKYYSFDEVMDSGFNTKILHDKLLLIGYLGASPKNNKSKIDDDRFFTPLNPRLSGRSLPDMYGTIIHANILRMALDRDFMYALPSWLNWILAFTFSWILMPLFVRWYVHKAVWFHLFTILIQLLISILFVYFTVLMYAKANIKIESSAVLVSVLLIGDFLLFYDHLVKFLKHKLKWDFHSKFFEGGH